MTKIFRIIKKKLLHVLSERLDLLRGLTGLFLITLGYNWCVSHCCKESSLPIPNTVVHSNNYFDPFALTFTNPLTHQMSHIITVYHYAMSFLVFIMLITFSYIVFSLRNIKVTTGSIVAQQKFNYLRFYETVFSYNFYRDNYKEFVKSRKFTHASILEFF
jgi:hypothetical protein